MNGARRAKLIRLSPLSRWTDGSDHGPHDSLSAGGLGVALESAVRRRTHRRQIVAQGSPHRERTSPLVNFEEGGAHLFSSTIRATPSFSELETARLRMATSAGQN